MAARPRRRKAEEPATPVAAEPEPVLTWLRATYAFHTFAYRDPRAAFSTAIGLPVVSPTTVLLGIVSTLFSLGDATAAHQVLGVVHQCRVVIDPPDGVVFFRAFHQLRRYHSTRKGQTHRAGLTNISQGTREHGLLDGRMSVHVGVPEAVSEVTLVALRNRDHLGTHDSLCSLVGDVVRCDEPSDVVYWPPERWQRQMPDVTGVMVVTLSRFRRQPVKPAVGDRWWMSGGEDTELVPYLIRGRFLGTSKGKIFLKAAASRAVE
jgi:hypothetical protein